MGWQRELRVGVRKAVSLRSPACQPVPLMATVTARSQITGQEETPGEEQLWKMGLRRGSNACTSSLPLVGSV